MRLFWMAWGFAVLLVLIGIGLTAWVFASSEHWPDAMRIVARAASLIVSLAAFVGAFRLALLATASLRAVLAQNLAALIVMELNDLRQAAQTHASVLAGEAGSEPEQAPTTLWQLSSALEIPRFFGERKEIRKLLGPTTEQVLEQLLLSLESYNQTVAEMRSRETNGTAAHLLWQKISVVQEQLKQSARELAPFCFEQERMLRPTR